jgi:hypothetical protein
MAREVEERRIGDVTYRVRMMKPMEAQLITFRLVQIFGDTIGSLFEGVDGNLESLGNLQMRAAGLAISRLAHTATEADMERISKAMLSCTDVIVHQADGRSGQFVELKDIIDVIHGGRMTQHFEWLAFALEVNFGDFFGESGPAGRLLGLLEKAFPSPPASTGGSTESQAAASTRPV